MSITATPQQETVVIPLDQYKKYLALEGKLTTVQAELAELKRLIFGRKSERFITPTPDGQWSLFDQQQTVEPPVQTSKQKISYERKVAKKKQRPVRALLPAHLPRQEEIIQPEGWHAGMKIIGEEVTEILEHVPGKLFVRRIVRPKYVNGQQDGVHIGELPCLPLPKANAGPGLLTHLQISKWIDHLPFYRLIQMLKREGVILSASTLNGWFNATAQLLEALYERLVYILTQQAYLQADESPIRVQDSHKKGTTHIGYHWVYHAPRLKAAVFDYQPSRSGSKPTIFLSSFQGHLQTDGYKGYNGLAKGGDVILLACMAHVRRYFEKALDNDKDKATYALQVIQSLYAIEREGKGMTSQERLALRNQQALPILNTWKDWLSEQQRKVLPKSSIGKAINYTLNLWERLIRYSHHGDFHIDNNHIENIIRPLAIGRKNYLFAGSHQGAQKAAMFYSFFACCKLNEVNPYHWLKDVL